VYFAVFISDSINVYSNPQQFQKISILPPQKGLEFPGGGRFFETKKKIKKCMKFKRNFQRAGEVLGKIPSVGQVWVFSGTRQLPF